MTRLATTIALLALSAAFSIGCTSAEDGHACRDDGDCQSGEGCYRAESRCVALASSLAAIEVLPPSSSVGWVRQEFLSESKELHLSSAVSLQGTVSASNSPDKPVGAHIRMWRPSAIPGRPSIFHETDTVSTADDTGKAGSFVLWLAADATYSLFVSPHAPFDTALPPLLSAGIVVTEHAKKPIVLDGPDRSVEVVGTVVDAEGKALTAHPVQLRAYHESGWIRSTLTRSCANDRSAPECQRCDKQACPGGFAFRVPFGVRTYTIRAEPTADVQQVNAGPSAEPPVVECPGITLGLSYATPNEQAVMQIEQPLRMPAYPLAKQYELAVVGGAQDEPVVGAQIQLETTLPVASAGEVPWGDCRATFRRVAVTDAEGIVRIKLLPGQSKSRTYSVVVVPPGRSRFATLRQGMLEVGPAGGVVTPIRLAERLEVRGTIVDAEGQPLADARIEAQGVEGSSGGLNGLAPGSASSETEADGSFLMYVDPGSFHISVVPNSSTLAPRFTWFGHQFKASSSGLVLRAPPARLWSGRIWRPLGAKGVFEPAAGYTLNAFDSAPKSSEELTAILQASTASDADGAFQLLLPGSQ